MPGVLIVEAMAQAASCLVVLENENKDSENLSVFLMKIDKARFRKPILPNQNIIFEVNFLNNVKDVYKFQGSAFFENIKVAETEFTAMITIGKK